MPDFHTLIIGAGFSGIGTAIALDKAGLHDYQILEAGDGAGGLAGRQGQGAVGLGVEVDDQGAQPALQGGRGEPERHGCLPHAALERAHSQHQHPATVSGTCTVAESRLAEPSTGRLPRSACAQPADTGPRRGCPGLRCWTTGER